MDLYIIRHGQSEADLLNVHEGRADYPLTSLGERQAAQLAEWLRARCALSRVIASPLRRAAQTAGCVAERLRVPLAFDEDLMEWQNGLLAGVSRADAAVRYPAPAVRYPHAHYHGCESMIEFRMRAENALSRLLCEYDAGECIAVVAHGGMINMLFRSFLGLPMADDIWLSSGDTAVHLWRVEGRRRQVVFCNSLAHLE